MFVVVNVYFINSNVYVYRLCMILMDSEYQLEQIDFFVFIYKCFVGLLRYLEYVCILLDLDCLYLWFSIINYRCFKCVIVDDRYNIYIEV